MFTQLGGDGGGEGTVWAVVEARGGGGGREGSGKVLPLCQQSYGLDVAVLGTWNLTESNRLPPLLLLLLSVPKHCCRRRCRRHLPTWLTYSLGPVLPCPACCLTAASLCLTVVNPGLDVSLTRRHLPSELLPL